MKAARWAEKKKKKKAAEPVLVLVWPLKLDGNGFQLVSIQFSSAGPSLLSFPLSIEELCCCFSSCKLLRQFPNQLTHSGWHASNLPEQTLAGLLQFTSSATWIANWLSWPDDEYRAELEKLIESAEPSQVKTKDG